MSQFDPTAPDNPGEAPGGERRMTYEEVSGLSNGELGLVEPHHQPPVGVLAAPAAPALRSAPAPVSSLFDKAPPVMKAVSGSYGGTMGNFQLDLRIDVDRNRPMKRFSGDLYHTVGKTTSYYGSFIVDSVTVSGTSQMVLEGLGRYTFAATNPVVQVTIPRVGLLQPQAAASLQFFSLANVPGATYHCPFASLHFRSVRIETDRALNQDPWTTYDTASLPSGGTNRVLSVVTAFAEAGIGLTESGGGNVIDDAEAGLETNWSNAELHASMEQHFSLWSDLPQWCVWQLDAWRHEKESLSGIMFDLAGKQRQGCATFRSPLYADTPDIRRMRKLLFVRMHELGHCFNLVHSWEKDLATPPTPNRPGALSWMNYPHTYPQGGEPGFWAGFDFRFDDEELIHLRHGFRSDVILGGTKYGTNASFGHEVMADPVADESGLALSISTHQSGFALGEPVVLQLRLGTTDTRGRRAHTWLHPDYGLVRIAIRKPGGELVLYEPMIDHLANDRQRLLEVGGDEIDSAYIGYGKDGLYFDQAGLYQVRAAYAALDGSRILSNILTIRVRYPVGADDDTLAELLMGDAQGALLYLGGSDNENLRAGNTAFNAVLDRFGTHRLATYVRMVKGINAGRRFKTIGAGPGKPVSVRPAQAAEGIALLSGVLDAGVLDPVSLRQTRERLAAIQRQSGDEAGARRTLEGVRPQ